MVTEAREKAKNLGSLNNSITGGAGNFVAYLAEIALAADLQCDHVSCDKGNEKYNYDLKTSSGQKIEAKTKRRSVDPSYGYDVSVAETSRHQKADIYAFISTTMGNWTEPNYQEVKSVWLCGFMPQKEYFEKAKFWKRGDVDKSNNFTVHANMFNMPIKELNECHEEQPTN